MPCYLGVDGGGTKTAFVLIDDTGHILARTVAGSSYYFNDGFQRVEHVLGQGIANICELAGIERSGIDAAFFGLPGYGEASQDTPQLDQIPGVLLGHHRYTCDNDMVCGWAGSLAGSDGINVISGTGSMTYGERRGVGRRVGGWGELFGDEGSAYWVAAQGLNAFSRMSDGRIPRGALHGLIRDRLDLADDLDAVSLIVGTWSGDRKSVAALATTICQAATAGDVVAAGILSAAVGELVALIETTRTLVGFTAAETVPVSYSGGMFADNGFRTLFHRSIDGLSAGYELRRPLLDPALGAALYAAKRIGSPLRAEAIGRLTAATDDRDRAPDR
ncbi:N-acetylglucosamine kinase [Mycolicibacterium frederiksbergense]|uniref:N-acetylglucosamine kinase n=1 Tax=Mycolicibacterium frederiksbergense TaxID=117567 RepID=UPI00399B9BAE